MFRYTVSLFSLSLSNAALLKSCTGSWVDLSKLGVTEHNIWFGHHSMCQCCPNNCCVLGSSVLYSKLVLCAVFRPEEVFHRLSHNTINEIIKSFMIEILPLNNLECSPHFSCSLFFALFLSCLGWVSRINFQTFYKVALYL